MLNQQLVFFLWGHNAYNAITKFYPYLTKKMYVVGHPRHDSSSLKIFNSKQKRNKILNIGFLTRNCYLNDYIQFSNQY